MKTPRKKVTLLKFVFRGNKTQKINGNNNGNENIKDSEFLSKNSYNANVESNLRLLIKELIEQSRIWKNLYLKEKERNEK